MSVRANAQYNLRPVKDPQFYQDFFASLRKSLFIQKTIEYKFVESLSKNPQKRQKTSLYDIREVLNGDLPTLSNFRQAVDPRLPSIYSIFWVRRHFLARADNFQLATLPIS